LKEKRGGVGAACESEVLEGIRQGLEDMEAGRTISLDEFKEHVRRRWRR
jgi:hypothetical protein